MVHRPVVVHEVRKVGDRCYRISPKLGFSVCLFFMIVELWVLKKNTTNGKCPSYHIILWVRYYPHGITGDVNLHHLVKKVFVRLIHFKFTIFSFSYSSVWKQVTKSSQHSRVWVLSFTTRRRNIYIYYWEFFIKKDLPVLSSFIYLILHLYKNGLIYLVYTLDYNPILDCLFYYTN